MLVPGLPALEQRLEARAGAGQRINELLDEIAELQQEIMLSPAVTLQDAAVKLRRLSVYLEDREAVERAVMS